MTNDKLVKIGELVLDTQDLSQMTYGQVPVDYDGPGAQWLRDVARQYLDEREDLLAGSQGTRDGIAERLSFQLSAAEVWEVVADLRLYSDAEDGRLDYGLWARSLEQENPQTFRRETVWAVPMDGLTDALEWWLYEAAGALLTGLRNADADMNGDPEDEEEEDDGMTLIAGVLYDNETGYEAEEEG